MTHHHHPALYNIIIWFRQVNTISCKCNKSIFGLLILINPKFPSASPSPQNASTRIWSATSRSRPLTDLIRWLGFWHFLRHTLAGAEQLIDAAQSGIGIGWTARGSPAGRQGLQAVLSFKLGIPIRRPLTRSNGRYVHHTWINCPPSQSLLLFS